MKDMWDFFLLWLWSMVVFTVGVIAGANTEKSMQETIKKEQQEKVKNERFEQLERFAEKFEKEFKGFEKPEKPE